MRYFRVGAYEKAASAFERLTKRQRLRFGLQPGDLPEVLQEVASYDSLPHERDALVSVRKLWHLSQSADHAKSRLRRAKSLYAMAAYMYRQRALLFYSPGLWKGQRSFAICLYWAPEVNNKADDRNLERYCHQHETLTHVLRLCHDVEAMHLHAPVVAKALYTEGLAADHLSNLNGYWRDKPGLKKRAVASMHRMIRLYPHDPLAANARKYAEVFQEEDRPDYNR
jgi:hypothetical protein